MTVNYRASSSNTCIICLYWGTRNIFNFKITTLISYFERQLLRVWEKTAVSRRKSIEVKTKLREGNMKKLLHPCITRLYSPSAGVVG